MAWSKPFSGSLLPPLTDEAVILNCGLGRVCPGLSNARLTRHFGGLCASVVSRPAAPNASNGQILRMISLARTSFSLKPYE